MGKDQQKNENDDQDGGIGSFEEYREKSKAAGGVM